MELIRETTDFQLHMDTAVALGKFDGIHMGHRRLLAELERQEGLRTCVFTFDPPPAVLFGASDGRELSTREEKRRLFERMGVDILIEFPLNSRTAAVSPEDFVREFLHGRMRARYIAAGEDISFGRNGAGDAALLNSMGEELAFHTEIIDKVCIDGAQVSSTRIRRCVETGAMEEAGRLLGAPYPVYGTVVPGNRIGRTIGFPTVNLCPPGSKLLPPRGVYYSRVCCGKKHYAAISNIGCKPTVETSGRIGLESYLYDFEQDIYGQEIEVELLAFRRPEQRFADIEALKRQLQEDIAAGAQYHRLQRQK